MSHRCRLLAAVFAASAIACGGAATAPTSAPQIQIAGSYSVTKTTVSDTCGVSSPGAVIVTPADVRHTPGAGSFVLVDHGTRELPGTVAGDGTFAMAPFQSLVQGTIAATDTFSGGRFTTTGFSVRDTTDLATSPTTGGPPCRIVADWSGAKEGAPNVLP